MIRKVLKDRNVVKSVVDKAKKHKKSGIIKEWNNCNKNEDAYEGYKNKKMKIMKF